MTKTKNAKNQSVQNARTLAVKTFLKGAGLGGSNHNRALQR
jgi:hypothetical protein